MKTITPENNGTGKPPGKTVPVTYKLKKSSFVSLLDNGFSIGYVNIDLTADQDADPNSFSTKPGKSYSCLLQDDGLQVTLFAEGKKGDFWTLELEIDEKAVSVNPIRVETDAQGHLDFNQLIKDL